MVDDIGREIFTIKCKKLHIKIYTKGYKVRYSFVKNVRSPVVFAILMLLSALSYSLLLHNQMVLFSPTLNLKSEIAYIFEGFTLQPTCFLSTFLERNCL